MKCSETEQKKEGDCNEVQNESKANWNNAKEE